MQAEGPAAEQQSRSDVAKWTGFDTNGDIVTRVDTKRIEAETRRKLVKEMYRQQGDKQTHSMRMGVLFNTKINTRNRKMAVPSSKPCRSEPTAPHDVSLLSIPLPSCAFEDERQLVDSDVLHPVHGGIAAFRPPPTLRLLLAAVQRAAGRLAGEGQGDLGVREIVLENLCAADACFVLQTPSLYNDMSFTDKRVHV